MLFKFLFLNSKGIFVQVARYYITLNLMGKFVKFRQKKYLKFNNIHSKDVEHFLVMCLCVNM